MTSRRLTIPTTGVTAAVLTVLLVGCGGSADPAGSTGPDGSASSAAADPTPQATPQGTVPSVAETTFPGAPDGVTGEETVVVVGDDARHVQVVTFGSSTCPVVPTDIAWDDAAQVLRITLSDPSTYDGVCTMDLVPTTSVVEIPAEAPDATGLAVELDGRGVEVR
ncbi:hypothetical protein [Cellulomonas dongxiuzhuiae]|uniref:Uncharacterized protein n=1 Tax=Cellulomonas dongxiuzhuiae TaxID=2819979 RepID=A0ABX8GLN9_9CELL|nr:hypothetical protein [Cellulomonas dongxiuzhuiae]MBO3095625.1 hypothetical protein [Cellulomonas dongxiuzhuiae]QWC16591.1 hypothetical protein KKR89_02680 [Cellulomonas dongxiuzhuiae]